MIIIIASEQLTFFLKTEKQCTSGMLLSNTNHGTVSENLNLLPNTDKELFAPICL